MYTVDGVPDEPAGRLDRRSAASASGAPCSYGGILIARRPLLARGPAPATFYLGLRARSSSARACSSRTSASSSASSTARRTCAATPAFSIFYMGINLGAFLGPLITGYLGAGARRSARDSPAGAWIPNSAWHWGFGAAGVGMTLGLVQYVLGGARPRHGRAATRRRPARPTSRARRKRAGRRCTSAHRRSPCSSRSARGIATGALPVTREQIVDDAVTYPAAS